MSGRSVTSPSAGSSRAQVCAISQSGCTKKPAVASTGSSPIGVAYDPANGDVYVADNDSPGTLSVFLGATLKAVTTVTVGQYPVAVTASPSGKQILVAGKANASYAGYGAVSVVDAATNKLTTYLAAGSSPSSHRKTAHESRQSVNGPVRHDGQLLALP